MPRFLNRNFGTALNFDGVDDQVVVTHASSINVGNNDSYSIACWVRGSRTGDFSISEKWYDNGAPVIDKYPWSLRTGGAGNRNCAFNIYDGTNNPGVAFKNVLDGRWHFIVAVRDYGADVIRAYTDSVLSNTTTDNTTGDVSTDRQITIGSRGAGQFFPGQIDKFRLFNKALTQAEITALYFQGTVPTGLIGEWLFNEGSGTTATDSSTSGNNGTITGATYTSDVRTKLRTASSRRMLVKNIESALNFDGVDDIITSGTISTAVMTSNTFSCTFKANNTVTGVRQTIAQYANHASARFALQIATTGFLSFGYYNGTSYTNSTSDVVIEKGIWYRVVCTFGGTTPKLYVNNILQAGTSALVQSDATTALRIGSRSGTQPFGGKISSVRLWASVLSSTELDNLYYSDVVPTSNLLVNYPLQEGAGLIAYDSSSNVNNGTITGAIYTSDTPTKKRKLVDGNLVKNGDFEFAPPFTAVGTTSPRWIDGTAAGSTTNDLFGWHAITGVGTVTYQFDTDTTYNGKTSIKIDCDATGRGRVVNATFETTTTSALAAQYGIKVSPSTAYTLTAYCKTTTAMSNAVYIDKSEYAGDGSIVGGSVVASSKLTGTNNWTLLSIAFTTNASTRYVTVRPIINVAGQVQTAWFADITLTPTTATTRTAA